MTTKRKPADSKMRVKSSSKCESLKCEDMEKALDQLHDYFNRAMCNFLLLGETAHAAYYREGLEGTAIEIGVKPTSLSQYAFSTLKTLIDGFGTAVDPVVGTCNSTMFNLGTIPVKMFILRRDSDVFHNPDTVFYDMNDYKIPNPFVKYYKNREYFE